MALIETGPDLWERLDGAPVTPEQRTADGGERLDREQLSARVRDALRGGSLDELEDAIVRETVGYLTDPYIDSNTLMGVQDLNPRLAAAWNNGARDLAKDERRREVSRARILSVFAPPAHNAVRQHQNYVIGQGVPKPTAAIGNADIQAVIDDLWSDPANHEFTTHNGQKRADANQIIDGELFVAIAIDEQDGHCKWRTVDPLDIDDLVTDPDDASRVLYYRVRQAKTDYDFGKGLVKDGSTPDKYVYFRDWRNTDPALDPYNGKAQPAAPEHMVMAHWPINTLGLRGIPDMVCAAPWIAAHKSFMNNRTILHEALSKIAFVKTVKGGAPAVNASALAEQSSLTNSQYSGQERNPQPAPYAIMTKNAGVDIEQLKVDSGASNAQTDGEMLAQMFSTGVGLPTHYSIMSVEAHRLATATAMELPVLKMFLSSQQGWLDMLRDLIDFALLQAATAGRIKAKIVTKHGRQLIDWDNSPASPEKVTSDDQPAAPSNVTPFRRKKAAASDEQASVREALEDTDAVAQAEHIEKAQEPSAQDKQAQKKRGHYTIDMPPILQKDVAATITAVVQALQAGTLTPELAANQVMIALGFDDVSDKMDEWRSYVQTQAQQAVDRAAQEHDMAQQQLAAKAGPPGAGGPPKAPPFGAAPTSSPQATAREAFTEAQLAVLAEAGLTLVREAGGGGHWITIEQDGESTHIFIGAHGMVTKGPKHLIGANIAHLPPIPGKRSVTHHPDGHVPAGHDAHPHYTEHQDKKHVYGKHGPGVGYDVDNPLPKKTAEQAEEGLQKSVAATKEHKAAQEAEQAKTDAETKAKADEAEKKAQIGKKNSEALAEAHEHKPFVVTQHPESGKYHVTHGLTATSHTTHETEDEAKKAAEQQNDSHYDALQKQYNDDEADKATSTHPYIKQTLTPGKFSVVNSEDYKAHSEHDNEEDADKALHQANYETYKAFLKKANEDNHKAIDATTPEQPYCVVINKPGEYELYNGQTELPTGHEPYDSLDEAQKQADGLNKQKVQAKTDKLHMAELLGHASTVHGQHYLMTLADHTLFGDSASTLTTDEKDGLETLSTFLFNKANGKPEATTNQLHDAIVKAALPLLETHAQHGAEVMQQAQDNMPSLQQTIAHEEAKASAAPKAASAAPAPDTSAAPQAPAYKNTSDVPVTTLKDGPNTTTPGAAHVVKLLVGDENGAHVLVGAVGMDGTAPNEHSEKWFIRQPTSADGISGAVVHGFTKKDALNAARYLVALKTDKLGDTVEFHKFVSSLQSGVHAGLVKDAQDYNNKADAAASPMAPWVVNQSTQTIGEWKAWNSQTGDFSQTFDSEQAAKVHADKLNSGTNPQDYLKQKYGAKYEQRERWREEAKASLPKPADTAKLAKKSQIGKARTKVKPDEAKRGREFLAEQHKGVTDSEAKEQIMVQQAERMRALGITDDDVKPFLNELRLGAGYAPDHELDTPLESAANYLTALWARSSADSHEISLAMQQVARDLFGQDAWTDRPDHVGYGAWDQATQRANDPAFRKAAEAYLHSSYHATQTAFKEAGITHIAVYRGVQNVPTPSIVDNFKKAKAAATGTYDHWQTYGEVGADEAWTNPLSSWAFASKVPSENFAGDNKEWNTQPNVVYYGMMPVSHIVSTFRSGYGCKLEDECVVIGHRTPLAYTVGRESSTTSQNLDTKLGAT